MSILNKLTEGIRSRDLQKEGDALLSKWEKTGLLEGMNGDVAKNGMARLLENQAAQLLKEASSMAAGDVEGFASVAFPLVRRVFGGLLANDIVSVQPMSLPSGLIFFLDFTYQGDQLGHSADASLYGGGVVGSEITGGVLDASILEDGLYGLQAGYSAPTASATEGSGGVTVAVATADYVFGATETGDALVDFDPDFVSGTTNILRLTVAGLTNLNANMLTDIVVTPDSGDEDDATQVRRLTRKTSTAGTVEVVFTKASAFTDAGADNSYDAGVELLAGNHTITFPIVDGYAGSSAVGSVIGQDTWGLEEPSPGTGNSSDSTDDDKNAIAEIDIKVDSVAVTAQTRKLKAKWSPELGQDLNAYHNLDAEVELTSILSEQIALEIDREILKDLIAGATAGTYYWSRNAGQFVNRTTGAEIGATTAAPDFTGTVSEWYETLVETINDVSAQIHRKTLRGGANFIVVSPEVANILEFTSGFRASVTADDDKGTMGAIKTGAISKKWDVYVDPYFPRNVVLVGREGGSFLESGYVYAPYVPLQVTPTIFGPEDFTPRKGVMTRYAKQMVRPDMYGLVIVRGLLGEAGKTSA